MADRPRRPRNANAATPLTTRRIIRTNTRIITVSRGQPRRARNAGLRRTEQQEPAERARQASARRLGRRLGIILERTQDQYQPEQRPQDPQPLLGSFVDPESEWEDVNPIADHARHFRLQRYAAKREETARQWAALDKEVVSAYLLYQDISENWSSFEPTFSDHPSGCTCAPADISQRNVDLVDLFAFIKSVSAYLDSHTRKPLLNRGSKHKRRELRVPFSHCIDLYLRILTNSKKIYEDGLRLSPTEKWANKCPRCFGPIQNEVKQNPAEPDINLNMDGNYQQRHYHHASKDCPREDQYPSLFLPPSKIASDIERISATENAATGINALLPSLDPSQLSG
ncbi:hypothetical protein MJO29_014270 [Puccinia striiformis f. sp. tritici]|nr:hypothetical protein MJO29_014270 [Puccinia striiformis f. sp. tritici]